MFRTDVPSASATLPTPATPGTPGYFSNGNPGTGAPPTIVDADLLNMIQEELMSILAAASITPSKTTYNQVLTAIRTLVAGSANVFTGGSSTNSANNYSLASVSPAATSFAPGQTVIFTPNATNTGAVQLNAAGEGLLPVKKESGSSYIDLASGDWINGALTAVTKNSNGTQWILSDLLPLGSAAYQNTSAFAPAAAGVPTGTVADFAGSAAPTGWLLCYGQSVSTTTYATLFSVIGYAHGGTGGNFNLPDYRGRTGAGADNMGGTAANRLSNTTMSPDANTLGASGGGELLQSHTHTANVTDPGHTHSGHVGSTTVLPAAGSGNASPYTDTSIGTATTGITVSNANAGGGNSQNVQPTIIINKIIKT